MPDYPLTSIDFHRSTIEVCSPESCPEVDFMCTYGTGVWPTANLAIFVPFVVYHPITVFAIEWFNGSAVAGNIDVGIYDEFGNKIVTLGAVAQAGTNARQKGDIADTALLPGQYTMAMSASSTSAQLGLHSPASLTHGRAMGCFQMASAHPLPATATYAAYAQTKIPELALILVSV